MPIDYRAGWTFWTTQQCVALPGIEPRFVGLTLRKIVIFLVIRPLKGGGVKGLNILNVESKICILASHCRARLKCLSLPSRSSVQCSVSERQNTGYCVALLSVKCVVRGVDRGGDCDWTSGRQTLYVTNRVCIVGLVATSSCGFVGYRAVL